MMVTNGHSDENCNEETQKNEHSIRPDRTGNLPFQIKETVLCFHGPLLYEAKILRIEMRTIGLQNGPSFQEPFYFIHYKGWKSKWDEWVQQDRLRSFDKELLLQQASCRAVENEPVEANEMEGKSLKNSSKAAGKKTTSAAGDEPEPASLIRKKRKRRSTMCSEEDSLCNKQPEPESKSLLKVNLTNNLWELLQEDFVEISHNKKIFDLPLEPSVSQILQQYLQQNKEEGTDIGEFVDGLEQCFNKALGLLLLYRFERQQYSDLFHDHHSTQTDVATLPNTCWKPSQHYGLIHLLRLLTKIATLFPEEKYPPEKIHHFSKRFDDLVAFLDRNWVALFSRRQYVSAPPQYRSLSKLV